MREKLIYAYFGVSLTIIWETIQTDLPILQKQINIIVENEKSTD